MSRLSKNKYWAVSLLVVSICLSCSVPENKQAKVFVSETFQNRFIDTGTNQVHDSSDLGFYTDHFDPAKIVYSSESEFDAQRLERDSEIGWQSISLFDSVLNFKNFITPNTNRVIYVAEYMYSRDKEEKLLSLGSDDGVKVWHNGVEIYSRNILRGVKTNNDFVELNLEKGWNSILYKVSQGDGGWGLYRNFKNIEVLGSLIKKNVYDIYNDMLETVIIEKGDSLNLKIDPRSVRDSFNEVTISIDNLDKNKSDSSVLNKTFLANKLPNKIPISDSFSGVGTFSVSINDGSNNLYKESIPIFYEIEVETLLKKVFNTSNNEIQWSKENAFVKLFNKGDAASTRMRAEAFYDLQSYNINGQVINSGLNILGYRSELDKSIQTYTVSYPEYESSFPLVYIMHGEYTIDSDYWDSYEGASHSLMTQRISASIENDVMIVMTNGRGIKNYLDGAEEELPLIQNQLKSLVDIESSHILVWSKGATSLFELLKTIELDLKSIGIISPFVPDDTIEMQQLISYIKMNYPSLRWFVRHGLNDEDSPISRTRKFIELLEQNNIEVDYEEIPYSTHWNYIYDQEREYYRYVNDY